MGDVWWERRLVGGGTCGRARTIRVARLSALGGTNLPGGSRWTCLPARVFDPLFGVSCKAERRTKAHVSNNRPRIERGGGSRRDGKVCVPQVAASLSSRQIYGAVCGAGGSGGPGGPPTTHKGGGGQTERRMEKFATGRAGGGTIVRRFGPLYSMSTLCFVIDVGRLWGTGWGAAS